MLKKQEQQEQFIEAFNQYSDALFRHSYFRVSNKQIALDMVQDTFTKTWLQMTRGEIIKSFQSYLYHVLNNLIIDYYRKKKSSSLDVLAEGGFDPIGSGEDDIIADAERGQLEKLLENLSPADRDVIVMRYIDGLQVKQIAKVLQDSENNISVKLHRAVKKLKSHIKK